MAKYSSGCPMCDEYTYEKDCEALAHPKAMRTAHDLAMKKSETPFDGFEKVDIYLLYFRRIYKHELKRTAKILSVRAEHECLIRNLGKEVCGYHRESQGWYYDDEFVDKKDYTKAAEAEYRNSKWPNMENKIK